MNRPRMREIDCPQCDGKGYLRVSLTGDTEQCDLCQGVGYVVPPEPPETGDR
jgi:RecJ-like exonuclease